MPSAAPVLLAKSCRDCGQLKPATDFYAAGTNWRRQGQCKPCFQAAGRRNYQRTRERVNRRTAATRRQRLLREHGQTEEGDQCAICGATPEDPRNGRWSMGGDERRPKRLAVDHDHSTGAFRGFLCANCNRALGYADDDPALLRQMAEYLEASRLSQTGTSP